MHFHAAHHFKSISSQDPHNAFQHVEADIRQSQSHFTYHTSEAFSVGRDATFNVLDTLGRSRWMSRSPDFSHTCQRRSVWICILGDASTSDSLHLCISLHISLASTPAPFSRCAASSKPSAFNAAAANLSPWQHAQIRFFFSEWYKPHQATSQH